MGRDSGLNSLTSSLTTATVPTAGKRRSKRGEANQLTLIVLHAVSVDGGEPAFRADNAESRESRAGNQESACGLKGADC